MTSTKSNQFIFPVAYAEVPEVSIEFNDPYLKATVSSVTKTGFVVDAYNSTYGNKREKTFSWTASGMAFV